MNSKKRKIDICITPNIIDLFDVTQKKIVIVDVFRATSAMCVALNNGASEVIPVSTIEDAKTYKEKKNLYNQKYLVAAERNGLIVPGFNLGNSPLLYANKNLTKQSLVITTTNGTLAIEKAKESELGMVLASFLNASAVAKYLLCENNHLNELNDVLILCSGWKGRSCIEDVLLAGLLCNKLLSDNQCESDSDSVLLARNMYELAKTNIFDFLSNSSYRKRMNLDEDVKYCLQIDTMETVPVCCQTNEKLFFYSPKK